MVSWLALYKGSHGELKKEVDGVRAGRKSTEIPQMRKLDQGKEMRFSLKGEEWL